MDEDGKDDAHTEEKPFYDGHIHEKQLTLWCLDTGVIMHMSFDTSSLQDTADSKVIK